MNGLNIPDPAIYSQADPLNAVWMWSSNVVPQDHNASPTSQKQLWKQSARAVWRSATTVTRRVGVCGFDPRLGAVLHFLVWRGYRTEGLSSSEEDDKPSDPCVIHRAR